MAAKTLSTYIGELSAGSSLGAGDKIPTLEGGAMVYFEGSWFQAADADLTTIAGLSPSNDDFLQRKAGAWANRTIAQVKTDLGVPIYARYVALLTQSGTDAPVATVLENTLGGTVVWAYLDVGVYTATLTNAFADGKTFCVAGNNTSGFLLFGKSAELPDDDTIFLQTSDGNGTLTDAFLYQTAVEIRVYP